MLATRPILKLETRVHRAPDIFEGIPEWLDTLGHYNVMLNITSDVAGIRGRFGPVAWNMATLNGQVYALPFRIGDSAVFANPALFKQAGIPLPTHWNWQTFLADAQKLTNTSKGVYGFAVPVSSAEADLGSSWDWLGFYFSTGGVMITNNRADFNSPDGVRALTYYVNLYRTYHVEPPSELTWTVPDVVQAFGTGKVAMWINGPWDIPTVNTSFPKLHYVMLPLPTDKIYGSAGGGTWIGISSETAYSKQALEFVEYMTSTSVMSQWAKDGDVLPTNTAVLNEPSFRQPPLGVFTDNLNQPGVRFSGLTPDNTALMDDIQTGIEAALSGSMTPTEALASIDTQWDAVLAKPY